MTTQWMPRGQWEALKTGEGCPMCLGLANPELMLPDHVDEYGRTIASLDGSVLRLAADQFSRGYCILISTKHGPEIHDLDEDPYLRYAGDLRRATRAIAVATGADKMNVEMLGNMVPHLHAHLIPRYYADPAGGARLLRDHEAPVVLSSGEHTHLAKAIARNLR